MNHHLYIITGSSRGMGLAIARQLLAPGHTVLCIARSSSDTLDQEARRAGAVLAQWSQDLALGAQASARLGQWLDQQDANTFVSAALINNAGVIPRIGPLSDTQASDLAHALRVGLEAPMQLTASFLHATQHWSATRKVLNISSGLGRRAMASQTAYCTAKAGMDQFTRCLALEEARKPNGATVCSLAPGVIDTDMQIQLRGADAAAFPDQGNFARLKTNGQLSTPADAAARVLRYLNQPSFGSNPVADVRD